MDYADLGQHIKMVMGSIVCQVGFIPVTLLTRLFFSLDLAAPDIIKFGIESKHSSPLTSTDELKQSIVDSLYEMRALCSSSDVTEEDLVASHL